MAVYVLLSFDDDMDAKEFVRNTVYGSVASLGRDAAPDDPTQHLSAEVAGVFKKPTMFCDCQKIGKTRGWTRGAKYGWWVCSQCGKPSKAFGGSEEKFFSIGVNLLPFDLLPEDLKMAKRKWSSPLEWTWLLPKKETSNAAH